jgi:hypothetical protein
MTNSMTHPFKEQQKYDTAETSGYEITTAAVQTLRNELGHALPAQLASSGTTDRKQYRMRKNTSVHSTIRSCTL